MVLVGDAIPVALEKVMHLARHRSYSKKRETYRGLERRVFIFEARGWCEQTMGIPATIRWGLEIFRGIKAALRF